MGEIPTIKINTNYKVALVNFNREDLGPPKNIFINILLNFKFKLTLLFVCISYFLKQWTSEWKGIHHEMGR